MRAFIAIVLPWLTWGVLDSGVGVALNAARPGSFTEDGVPAAAAMLAALLVLRAIYSFIAGWIAGRLARGRTRVIWAAIGLLLVTGVLVQVFTWALYPVWYHVLFLVSIVPCAMAGARLGGRASGAAILLEDAGT